MAESRTPRRIGACYALAAGLIGCAPPSFPAVRLAACSLPKPFQGPWERESGTFSKDRALPNGWRAGPPGWNANLVTCGLPSARRASAGDALLTDYEGTRSTELAQLGGDYWTGGYDIRPVGRCYLDTHAARVELLSPPLRGDHTAVSFLLGGGARGANVNACEAPTRVELCVDDGAACTTLPGQCLAAPGVLGMQRAHFELPRASNGVVRLRIVDTGADPKRLGLTFDDLLVTNAPPRDRPPPLWGFVELHAHVFNDLGSGGRLVHGSVFDHAFDQRDHESPAARIRAALGESCEKDHGAFGLAFTTDFGAHGSTSGFPDFTGWPTWSSLSHQQMYIDWIARAYRGGLRLIQVDAGNNSVFGEAYEQMNVGIVPPLPDDQRRPGDGRLTHSYDENAVLEAELAEARRFADPMKGPAKDFAEIAETPQQAREIAAKGKLVLVLGAELDRPAYEDEKRLLEVANAPEATARPVVRRWVEWIRSQGVRHVFPVHVMPNVFGQTAVYARKVYCGALPETGRLPELVDGMSRDIRFHVDRAGLPLDVFIELLESNVIDPVPHPGRPNDRYPALGALSVGDCRKLDFSRLSLSPGARGASEKDSIGLRSTRGKGGLTALGRIVVEEYMRVGMLIDVTHMGEDSLKETLSIAEKYGYPIQASHSTFREMAFGNRESPSKTCTFSPPSTPFDIARLGEGEVARQYGTTDITKVSGEYGITRAEMIAIRKLEGMVGVSFELPGVGVQWAPEPVLDCDGSSKSFGQTLLYARDVLGGHGLGIGTDANGFYPFPPPRFGAQACTPVGADADHVRYHVDGGPGNARQDPSTKVRYRGDPPTGYSAHPPLRQYASPRGDGRLDRPFDVNSEGVAHYGLIPDFLQDTVNVGLPPDDMAPLFDGLEDYLRMWELVEEKKALVRAAFPDLR